jgi:CelD/BcsL family acetyltransferase involved in cellulose biosynthesis
MSGACSWRRTGIHFAGTCAEGHTVFEISIEKTFDFLSDEYAALFASSSATPFQRPLWLDRLYRRLAPRLDVDPIVIAARWSSTGRLAMILPLVRRRHGALRVIEFADLQVSDYASPVCEDAVFAQLVASRKACEDIRRALKPFDLLRIPESRRERPPARAAARRHPAFIHGDERARGPAVWSL